ncbi:MAG: SpoIIE family protein phosphatase [Bryobacteraceae bacterium]
MNDTQLQLRNLLRGDIAGFVVSLIVLFVGLAALVVQLLRLKSKNRSLLWFGLFAALYGLRSIARHAITQALFDAPTSFWNYLDSVITNVIITPALLFFEEVYGKGWRSSLRWLLWIQAAWGAAAIVIDFAAAKPWTTPDPANLLLVALPIIFIAGYAYGYRPPQSTGATIIFTGGAIFIFTVIYEHLVGANLVPWRFHLETFGFLANLVCLGYVAVRQFVGNEQELVAIGEEMKSARRIQASILPQGVPKVPGLRIAVRYIPMTAVAGDFYDFLLAGPGSVGILVADVIGHGVPAALVASMVKVAISSQADRAADPARVISALNQVMSRQVQGQFITAGYLFVDLESRTALYAAAGHPPLLQWRQRERCVREFRENGLLMGVRPTERYTNMPIELEPGDRLLLYTDGIPEASNAAGEFFGDDRLKEFIAAQEGLDADAFADALLAKLAAWSGSRSQQTDDVTLVVVDVAQALLPAQIRL